LDIGTGIFLSFTLLGMIALYWLTRDTWKWKRLVIYLFGGVVVLLAIVGGGIYLYSLYSDRAVPQESLAGIKLGMTENDVRFLKGEPNYFAPDHLKKYELMMVHLSDSGLGLLTYFADGKVVAVIADLGTGSKADLPLPRGMESYDKQDEIQRKFGIPTSILESSNGVTRRLVYPDYNIWFDVTKDGITALGVNTTSKFTPPQPG